MPITCQSHANLTSITCQSRPNHTCHEEGVVSPLHRLSQKHILQQFCSRRCPNASNILIGRQNIFSQECVFGPTARGGWVLAWDHLGVTSASSRDHLLATAWHGFWGCYGFYGFYGFYAVRGICGSHLPQNPGPGSGSPEKNFWRQASPLGSSGHPRLQNGHKRCFWDSRRPKFLQSFFKACSKLVQSLSKASPKLLHRHPPSGRGPVCVTRSPKIEKYPIPRCVHWAHLSNKLANFCSSLSHREKPGEIF